MFSPLQVRSWFDEVKEREAVDNYFENDSRKISRLEVIRRHGRADALLIGWDGSPSELQPYFVNNSYLTAAHYLGYHVNGNLEATGTATSLTSSVSRPELCEAMAKKRLEQQDFRSTTTHQLLDSVRCLASDGELCLGIDWADGGDRLTAFSKNYKHLCRYILSYLRYHGMSDQVTTIKVTRNNLPKVRQPYGKGVHWVTAVGNSTDATLWVECKSKYPPRNSVLKPVGDAYVPGFYTYIKDRVLSFRADCYYDLEPFDGELYGIVAYSSMNPASFSIGIQRKMLRLGFFRSSRGVWCTNELDCEQEGRPDWLDDSVHDAYPARAWQPPNDGETMVMDTSGEEANDGGAEPPSRAQRQALKKELPWRAMSSEEIPKFVQAVLDEWSEWQKWSSCRPVYVDASKIDPSLILKSRVCFRWKPKTDGDFKPKARIVIAGYKDPICRC